MLLGENTPRLVCPGSKRRGVVSPEPAPVLAAEGYSICTCEIMPLHRYAWRIPYFDHECAIFGQSIRSVCPPGGGRAPFEPLLYPCRRFRRELRCHRTNQQRRCEGPTVRLADYSSGWNVDLCRDRTEFAG